MFGSTLTTGKGGLGSGGSLGGQSTKGLAGEAGLPACRALAGGSACFWDGEGNLCTIVPFSSRTNTPGVPGGPGGNGGNGGPGGPGAGGPSYALVAPTGATVQIDATSTLAPGQGGLGGDGVTTAEALAQKRY
ncbi:MAG TPA: hypothetical protein VFS00_06980 [Polyangiaceae bacterium]|nr:hypothetical protein [Polyangiaceae bacterium]